MWGNLGHFGWRVTSDNTAWFYKLNCEVCCITSCVTQSGSTGLQRTDTTAGSRTSNTTATYGLCGHGGFLHTHTLLYCALIVMALCFSSDVMSHSAPQRNGVSLQWKWPISGFAELTSNQINSFHYTSYGFFRRDSQNAKKNVYIFWLRHQMWDRCANCFLLLFVPRFHSVHLRGQWLDVQRIKASPVSWWALKSTPTLNWCNCAIICTHHVTAKEMLSPSTRQTNTQTLWPTNSPSASALGKLLKWKNRNFLKFLRESIASSQKNASQWVLFAVSG